MQAFLTRELRRHESVTTGECNRVCENRARGRIARTQPRAGGRILWLLSLQTDLYGILVSFVSNVTYVYPGATDIELEIVDIVVERLSGGLTGDK